MDANTLIALLQAAVPGAQFESAPSIDLQTTVMPFIIRGVSLLGIASAGTARAIRDAVWQHLATDWRPAHLDRIVTREVTLVELPAVFDTMLAGDSFGRTVVKL